MNVVQFGRFAEMRELALFAGAGGGILGGKLLGWRTVCAVEIDDYPRRVLLQRQRDGILDHFPIWDDVCTFDGRPWRGKIDVISGGFPCQDISTAGKGLGIERGERSGLWREYARIIREVRPRYVFVENSPMLTKRGIGIVLGDLAEAGYDAEWKVLSAEECGAPHKRDRMWIVGKYALADAVSSRKRWKSREVQDEANACDEMADASVRGCEKRVRWNEQTREASDHARPCSRGVVWTDEVSDSSRERDVRRDWSVGYDGEDGRVGDDDGRGETPDWGWQWWEAEPGLGRVADGLAYRVDRLKAIGNGQVPIVAARAFCELYEQLNGT